VKSTRKPWTKPPPRTRPLQSASSSLRLEPNKRLKIVHVSYP
jgi:hypothetical protein